MKPTLYKLNARKKYQVWEIKYDSEEELLIITHGQNFGKMTVDRVKVKTNTSGRNIQEQADLEMNRRYENKLRGGYSTSKLSKPPISPMLAKTYGDVEIKNWPVAMQPKLDGVRCLMYGKGGKIMCISRGAKEWNHLSHIFDDVTVLIDNLPEGSFVDGELYIPGMIQSKISGIVRAVKNISPYLKDVKYCIFDIGGTDLPFEEREKILTKAYFKCETLRFISSYRASDDDGIIKLHEKFVRAGFEGSIIRDITAVYKNTRCAALLKMKDWFEEKATIIDIYESKGRETGLAMFKVVNDKGIDYKSRPATTFSKRKEYFDNKDNYIGEIVDSKYYQISANGKPLYASCTLRKDRDFEF
uniref:DNA ligase n=1 Tax=Pithovirus LCPAC403 TaxID=2506596 RepID=A0A481ZBX0_9VIRU|nr:MAG: ATP-dependent DNA ligase [Pithovirus LCPAC403]